MSSSYQKTLDWLSSLTLPRKDERHSYGRRRRLVEHRIYRLRYFAIIIIIRHFTYFSRLRDLFSLEFFIFSAVTEEQLSMSVLLFPILSYSWLLCNFIFDIAHSFGMWNNNKCGWYWFGFLVLNITKAKKKTCGGDLEMGNWSVLFANSACICCLVRILRKRPESSTREASRKSLAYLVEDTSFRSSHKSQSDIPCKQLTRCLKNIVFLFVLF